MYKIENVTKKATIVCPSCMEDFETEIVRVINLSTYPNFSPENINLAKCPYCGADFRVGERILIYDDREKILFILYPDEEEEERFVRSVFREMKSIIKDISLDLPEPILIVGYDKFAIMWELKDNNDLLNKIDTTILSSDKKAIFYRKLEIVAEIMIENGISVENSVTEENIKIIKERLKNIVRI